MTSLERFAWLSVAAAVAAHIVWTGTRLVRRSASWTVMRAHRLSEEIEARIRAAVPQVSVFTHIEPISDPASYEDQGLDR